MISMIAFQNEGLHLMLFVTVELFANVDEKTIYNFARKKKVYCSKTDVDIIRIPET